MLSVEARVCQSLSLLERLSQSAFARLLEWLHLVDSIPKHLHIKPPALLGDIIKRCAAHCNAPDLNITRSNASHNPFVDAPTYPPAVQGAYCGPMCFLDMG